MANQFFKSNNSSTGFGRPLLLSLALGIPALVPAAAFYVSPSGSDANPGTLAAPLKTINAAANKLNPGDVCYIRAGVYRESVRPARSGTSTAPIVFQPYNGESVTINGADVVTGWTKLSNGLWQAPIAGSLGQGNDQLFISGEMSSEARWPNASGDEVRNTYSDLASGSYVHNADDSSTVTLNDPKLTLPASAYVGAIARWWPGENQSVAQTGTVTGAGTGILTVKSHTRAFYNIVAGNDYALYGKTEFIDQPGEWTVDAVAKKVTLMAPGGDATTLKVEMKRRELSFDLSDRSYITISGIRFFGTTIRTNGNSAGIAMRGLYVSYPSHFLTTTSPWGRGWDTSGLWVQGKSNLVEDCVVEYSAGNGVSLVGSGHTVRNNVLHDVNYAGGDMAGVYCTGSNFLVQNNTMYNAPRSLIVHNKTTGSRFLNNELYFATLHSTDAGATYTKNTDGLGTELAYNLVHDIEGHLCIGMFLDNASHNYKVHHNVLYAVEQGLKVNRPAYNNTISNNTAQASSLGLASANSGLLTGTRIVNNVFDAPVQTSYVDAIVSNNLDVRTDARFVDKAKPDLRLTSVSPAVNAGLLGLPGEIGIVGAVDLGAYELGSTPPSYGADISWAPAPAPTDLNIFVDGGVANLSWRGRSEAQSYAIYRSTSLSGPYTFVNNAYGTTYTDAGLTNGATYYYRVASVGTAGEGGFGDVVSCVPQATTDGTGLYATYFNDTTLTTKVVERNETGVNLSTASAPVAGVNADNFSIRWEGQVQAPVTGTYTFTTSSDDSIRLWVNGTLVIDSWTAHALQTDSGTINLDAGRKYDIKVEYKEGTGTATAKLMWSYPGTGSQLVPTSRLYAPVGAGVNATYYNDTSTSTFWTKNVLQNVAKTINFDWAGFSPNTSVQNDNFTALYNGRFWAPETGTYTFSIQGDNGVKLYIDGKLVINQWYWNTGTWTASVALNGLQKHDIRLEYAERTGYAILKLNWKTPSALSSTIMPETVLFQK